MQRFFRQIGLFLAMLLALSTAATACARPNLAGGNSAIPSSGKISHSLLNKAILVEVNYTRCRAGLHALKSETRLVQAAAKHAKWMAKHSNLSHTSNQSGNKTLQARMKRTGLTFKTGSENISRMAFYRFNKQPFYVQEASKCSFTNSKGQKISQHSYTTLARDAVKAWAESPKHRVNLMDNRMRYTATAAAVDRSAKHCGSIYLTQDFLG